MPLSPGDRLGHYEVVSLLGRGGMGEVYRARDSALRREVALKVLPAAFLRDADRMARFQREAQVLASLDHPNIGHIFGVAETDDSRGLVLALIEGPTLAERLAGGPILIPEAIAIARQIAEALEYAHERGVVHRDLKPANVKITPDGSVKVLDFGLAKVVEDESPASSPMDSPTMTLGHTQAGVILGTAAYMSPEQAVGRPVDRRSDIFSFGALVYEMLTGTRAFRGAATPDVLEAVMRGEPDWSKLPPETPKALERLLRRCLTKDRKQRLQSIGEARIALENPGAGDAAAPPPAPNTRTAAWAFAGLMAAAAAVFAFFYFHTPPPKESLAAQLSILPPPNLSPDSDYAPMISPDGTKTAFLARDVEGKSSLWVRSLDSLTARPIAGTEGARSPFWSADGLSLNFQTPQYEIRRVDLNGVLVGKLCDRAFFGFGGAGNAAGQVLLGSNGSSGLYTVRAIGGRCEEATRLDAGRMERGHSFPQFLPDGRHFLYLAVSAKRENTGIVVGSLDSADRKFLFATPSPALYTPPGYLLFLREQTLVAQRFDLKTLELSGEPMVVAENIATSPYGDAMFSVSPSGVLIYRSGTAGTTQLTWFDHSGKLLRTAGPPGEYLNPELSADGKQVAFQRRGSQGDLDIWQMNLERGTPQRFTFSPADEINPVWSPDGSLIAFGSSQEAAPGIYQKHANGAGGEDLLFRGVDAAPMGWSLDGKFIVFRLKSATGMNDAWALPASGDGKAFGYLSEDTSYSKNQPRPSPNGHWLAYYASLSGHSEIYLEPFPTPGGKWQVSSGGGASHRWSRDGKELYFLAPNSDLMAVTVKGDTAPELGAPVALFKMRVLGGARTLQGFRSQYDVAPDGKFLVNVPLDEAAGQSITVMLDWQLSMKK